jgi:16S rRNA (guanine527-N7)-methyltransferase
LTRESSQPTSRTSLDLCRLFAAGDVFLSDEQRRILASYLDLLMRWSKRMSLTGFRTHEAAAEGLLFDAIAVASLLARDAHVVDVGAGAGGLATALSVLRPDLALVLVEARSRRAAFLRAVRRELGLTTMTVVEGRVEDAAIHDADAVYARALMGPRDWQALARTIVRPTGTILCLTAHPLEPSERDPALAVVAEERYSLPESGLPRVVTALRSSPREGSSGGEAG